ncbi:DUF1501 domain-containing protein [Paludisphaera borealis]|uniref:DUF1501 domain-containing protein n=1 Tax=Paludisphaera borealis TaxID=1387353 RepID=A0A1U7CTN5_9BACT|nr:DUF1501 domain-containing protein [Paludisphaera borealis]APW62307.1 hypothetical protein BSF38_03846 [Paludisphaera borealis]
MSRHKRPQPKHDHGHAFTGFNALEREGLVVASRRNMLKASVAGLAGLGLPDLLELRARASAAGTPVKGRKAVILLWMTGGPSHIDTWDPKPNRPLENRGPFGVIASKLPGVFVCEHLPKQAAMLDKFTIIRSVDAKFSNHEPNKVFQTANLDAEPRLAGPSAEMYPAIASIVAKHHGANQPGIPPYVAFQTSRSHIAYGGHLGRRYDPFIANRAGRLPIYNDVGVDTGKMTEADFFHLPRGLTHDRLKDRRALLTDIDGLRRDLDRSADVEAMGRYGHEAMELLVGRRAQEAFDISNEPEAVRDRYGKHLWCQQALLARRLVEAGVAFVTLDLSYHTASGTWDTHGDNIPPYGGISKGLKPLLPIFDHLITTLVSDLGERGLLDDVLVVAMGEFGRTPLMGTQGSTDGRNHWAVVMSMAMAGGGLRHGQVIGSTESDGGHIKERPVTPGDLAATIYRHMGVPLDATYPDGTGRPRFIVDRGEPIAELF